MFSLQDQAEALALADSLVLLDGGRVVAAGGADELYARRRRRPPRAFSGPRP
ncbi:hypothetical protein [Chenggangzhangella methanolivorans]|uniref:ABC transporter ATP-binding protein n=1 Tax=Chenggangzhangella methanolivorans TaxID=1437009 RepID=A0A9E6R8B8_9HYPH|nr:hypothetical protein [Chenggangzhangella methanolivorans]QZN98497.1 hypothetical protein K6K41_15695 [Chenggangzhangella methanolivorans]